MSDELKDIPIEKITLTIELDIDAIKVLDGTVVEEDFDKALKHAQGLFAINLNELIVDLLTSRLSGSIPKRRTSIKDANPDKGMALKVSTHVTYTEQARKIFEGD